MITVPYFLPRFWAMIIYFPDGPSRFRMKRRKCEICEEGGREGGLGS